MPRSEHGRASPSINPTSVVAAPPPYPPRFLQTPPRAGRAGSPAGWPLQRATAGGRAASASRPLAARPPRASFRAGLCLPPSRGRRQRGLETWRRGRRMHRNCLRLRGGDGAAAPVASVPLALARALTHATLCRWALFLSAGFLLFIHGCRANDTYLIYADCRIRSLYNQSQEPLAPTGFPFNYESMMRPKRIGNPFDFS